MYDYRALCACDRTLLGLALSPAAQDEMTDHGGDEHREVNERDPGLVIDVELLESEAPRMLDEHPADEVDHDTDACPERAGRHRLLKREVLNLPQIKQPEQREKNDVIERVPRLRHLITHAHSRALRHGAHAQHEDIEDRVPDPHPSDHRVANHVPQKGHPDIFSGTEFS